MGTTVAPAGPDDHAAACRLLASRRPAEEREEVARRFLDLLDTGEFDPAGLFVTRGTGGAVCGAVLAQAMPGALGLLFPPQTAAPEDRLVVTDALLTAAQEWLRGRGVKVCQSFAPTGDRADRPALERTGFARVTTVVHLRRELDPGRVRRGVDPAACPLALDPFTPADLPVFTDTLLATYEGSLDCPELTGTRTPADLVSGFRGPPTVRPDWWFLARRGGEPVGVVMLDLGVEPGVVELNYLGLVPAARGRGWGDWLVRFAARAAVADDARAVSLSVDARNTPARRLYERHGFRECDRRDVYLWCDPAPTSPEILPPG
jgi:GNAT superfamily N-acetyltransferase